MLGRYISLSAWKVVILTTLFIAIVGLLRFSMPHWPLPLDTIKAKPRGPLTFKRDGTFQISIFEDLHFGENAWTSWGPQQDVRSVQVMNQILDAEPEIGLVVLNGDLITGECTFLENSTHYVEQIVSPMVQRDLTWASTYGNHDSGYNISRKAILAREQRWSNSRTNPKVFDKNAGVTNYFLPVYDSNCSTHELASVCTPSLLLWFFDSRGGHFFQQKDPTTGQLIGQPDWVDVSVVEWFQHTNAALVSKAGRAIPSLAFVHIPVNASLALQNARVDAHRQPGINDEPVSEQGQGWCADGTDDGSCEYGGQDTPFMQAITTTPGLMALFTGHDHGNTWCYKWQGLVPGLTVKGNGINLCFGQHTGYGGYGDWIRGSRQVVVSLENLEDLVVDTYIRLESGDVVGAVSLNATYGQDVYPVTPNDKT
ncbi:Metallo-dependent phosphatase-like protein [Apodospora peruviana]|uniref:Metallo-dependent phosphatase-like protein n=1 Tax=Apodospora peruviana TaxID=516989 RepID=A0AAE0HUW1_9PEZI|nr:Metallo-dependent phosphatase-like protein [Apodospora peruviana]